MTERENSYPDQLLSSFIKSHDIDNKDRRLLTELIYGTLRNKLRLDAVIYDCTDKKKRIDDFILNVLRVSVYQLLFLDRIPHFAAINEAVKIVKSSNKSFAAGFVNAVLRKAADGKARYQAAKSPQTVEEISDYYSFPVWLTEYFIKRFGRDGAIEFFKYSMTPSKVTIRRTRLCDTEALARTFDIEGVRYEKHPVFSGAYTITLNTAINELESFQRGYFIVQSLASSLIARLLSLNGGETVLDLCSAPGTKAVQIAENIGAAGHLLAFDIHRHRLIKVKENLVRLGIDNVSLIASDAASPLPLTRGFLADRILLDVPCSGLGTVQKKPEIKYKVSYDGIKKLAKIQLDILQNASRYLKPDGKMVYSTCSLADEENEQVVKKFLDNNEGFMVEEIDDPLLRESDMIDDNGFFKTTPHIHETDGFFAAVIIKKPLKKI